MHVRLNRSKADLDEVKINDNMADWDWELSLARQLKKLNLL